MKTFLNIFFVILLIAWINDGFGQSYCTNTAKVTRTDRRTTSMTFTPVGGTAVTVSPLQLASGATNVYWDKTTAVISIYPNKSLTITRSGSMSWMHSYLYIDWNKDGTFSTVGAFTDNVFNKAASDLVAFSYYSAGASSEINSENETVSNSIGASLPNSGQITIPADAAPGDYRMRFVTDWNSINPCGNSDIGTNGGIIADVTLRILEPVPVTLSLPVTNITQTEVTLNGSYEYFTPSEIGFKYRKVGDTTWQAEVLSEIVSPFTFTITGLLPETNYEYYAYTIDGGTSYDGALSSFTTLSTYCTPTLTTSPEGPATNRMVLNNLKTLPTSEGVKSHLNYTPTAPNGNNNVFYKLISAADSRLEVLQGAVLQFQLNCTNTWWGGMSFYVDVNGDGEFDASEAMYAEKGGGGGGTLADGERTVTCRLSPSIPLGVYRMRVTTSGDVNPCLNGVEKVYDIQFRVLSAFSVISEANPGGRVTGGGLFESGTTHSVTVTATPHFGTHRFKNWTSDADGLTVVSADNPYTFDFHSVENLTLYANFEESSESVVATDSLTGAASKTVKVYGAYANLLPTEIGFEYKLSSEADWSGAVKKSLTEITSPFIAEITGLRQGKTYNVRAYAVTDGNPIYGATLTFTTLHTIAYVTDLGNGEMDGTSWEHAVPFSTLPTQLGKAEIAEVHLAGGTYSLDSTLLIPVGKKVSGSWNPLTGTQDKPTNGVFDTIIYPFDFLTPTIFNSSGFTTGYVIDIHGKMEAITVQNGAAGGVQVWTDNVEIVNSCIVNNNQPNGTKRAAGIYLRGAQDGGTRNTKIEGCLVSGNKITGSPITDNWVADVAGGIGNTSFGGENSASNASTVQITNSIVANNFSINGTGGISITGRFASATSLIKNCLVINNETNAATPAANYEGGRIAGGISTYQAVTAPVLEVINSTIAYNKSTIATSADRGVGGVSGVKLVNSIVYGNIAETNPSETTSLISGSSNNHTSDPAFILSATIAGNDADWNIANYSLKDTSACIDAGTATNAPTTDILGTRRPLGLGYDIGAYEFIPPVYTITIATEDADKGHVSFITPEGIDGNSYTGIDITEIKAEPNEDNGYYFVAWKDEGGHVVSKLNPYIYSQYVNKTLTAYFDNRYPLKYRDVAQSAIAVMVADTIVNNNDSIPFGTSFTSTVTSTTAGYRLLRWWYGEDVSTESMYSGIFDPDKTLSVVMDNKYKINLEFLDEAEGEIAMTDLGGNLVADGDSIIYDAQVKLTCIPNVDNGYYFTHWSNNQNSDEFTTDEITVPVTQDIVYTGHVSNLYEVRFNALAVSGGTGNVSFKILNGETEMTSGDKIPYKTLLKLKVISDNPLDFVKNYTVNGNVYTNTNPGLFEFSFEVSNILNTVDAIMLGNGIKMSFAQPEGATVTMKNLTTNISIVHGDYVSLNDEVEITVTPNNDYYITSFKVDDVEQPSFKVTQTITKPITINVTTSNLRKVTFAPLSGGQLSVESNYYGTVVNVVSGDDVKIGSILKFVITPEAGYSVKSFTVGGEDKTRELNNGVLYPYTLKNADLQVEVEFAPIMYRISYVVDGNDNALMKIRKGNVEVEDGGMVEYNTPITIELQFPSTVSLLSVLINGIEHKNDVVNNSLDIKVTEDLLLLVSFASIPTYTIIFSTPQNGTIEVKDESNTLSSGAQVIEGTVLYIRPIPENGYKSDALLINGVDKLNKTIDGVLTDTVKGTYRIEAEFAKITTGIRPDFAKHITLSPIPFSTTLTISGLPTSSEITIINVSGTNVGSYHAENSTITINTATLSQGLYWVKITCGKESTVYKALKW